MADELQDPTPAPGDELDDFARSFTADEPAETTTPTETPPTEPEKPAEETKPEPEKPAEEEENPFKVEEKPATEEEKEPEKPASNDDWSRLRESRNKYKAAAEERDAILREKEAEVAELKVKAARTAELEDKLKVFDEQEKKLALADIKATIDYVTNIEEPLIEVGKQAESLAKLRGADLMEIERMLKEPDPIKQAEMLEEITDSWSPVFQAKLMKVADDARMLLDKQDQILRNAHAAAKEQKEIAAKRDAEQKEISRKEFTKAATDAVKSVREKLPFMPLVEGETEEDRYSSLEQKVAQVDFEAQTPRAKALAVASTLALPQAIKTIAAKDAEITSLKEALERATKGKPSVNTKAETAPDTGEKDFFAEFGIKDRSNMFGSMSLDVTT